MNYTKSDIDLAKKYKGLAEKYNLTLYDMYQVSFHIFGLKEILKQSNFIK